MVLKLRFICQYSGSGVAVVVHQELLGSAKLSGLARRY